MMYYDSFGNKITDKMKFGALNKVKNLCEGINVPWLENDFYKYTIVDYELVGPIQNDGVNCGFYDLGVVETIFKRLASMNVDSFSEMECEDIYSVLQEAIENASHQAYQEMRKKYTQYGKDQLALLDAAKNPPVTPTNEANENVEFSIEENTCKESKQVKAKKRNATSALPASQQTFKRLKQHAFNINYDNATASGAPSNSNKLYPKAAEMNRFLETLGYEKKIMGYNGRDNALWACTLLGKRDSADNTDKTKCEYKSCDFYQLYTNLLNNRHNEKYHSEVMYFYFLFPRTFLPFIHRKPETIAKMYKINEAQVHQIHIDQIIYGYTCSDPKSNRPVTIFLQDFFSPEAEIVYQNLEKYVDDGLIKRKELNSIRTTWTPSSY